MRSNYLIHVVLLVLLSFSVNAKETILASKSTNLEHLLKLDLRELMDVKISLASRSEEEQFNAATAIYVLTSEDIRRSGHRRLPEILRMVPGLHVAKLDNNKWAVSSRNSQSRFSSTMLVMIDGRHVYTPFYAGVYWESQDTFIEDIERIEIVRGPGGPLWGANAVDGIINIITKSASDTHGIKAYALSGRGEMKYEAGIRSGGRTKGGISYRVFAKSYKTDSGEYLNNDISSNDGFMPVGTDSNDDADAQQVGFRMDWTNQQDNYMFQANRISGDFNEDRVVDNMRVPNEIMTDGYNVLFHWKRKLSETQSFALNTFYDQITRNDSILQNDESTFDIDLQHNIILGKQNITWGLGYREYKNDANITDISSCSFATPCFGVDPSTDKLSTVSAFIQDRITYSNKFALIVGSKFEDNDYTGYEYQPTLRGLWTPNKNTTYWAAATRAVRVPNRVNTDGILDFNAFTVSIGDKDKESFINYAYELGYRKRFSNTWLLDTTAFYSDYRNTLQKSASGLDNVFGFEGYLKYQVSPRVRLEFGYTYQEGDTVLASGGDRATTALPMHTAYLRSNYDLKDNMELDTMIYYVDESKSVSGNTNIPDYTRLDLRYGWRPTKQFDISVLLTNMLEDAHTEARDPTKINTGINRGIMLKATYTTSK